MGGEVGKMEKGRGRGGAEERRRGRDIMVRWRERESRLAEGGREQSGRGRERERAEAGSSLSWPSSRIKWEEGLGLGWEDGRRDGEGLYCTPGVHCVSTSETSPPSSTPPSLKFSFSPSLPLSHLHPNLYR